MKKRVITYFDGFNLWHALKDLRRQHLKWLNLYSLSESLLQPGQELVEVNYFSAYARWLPLDQQKRHEAYTTALQHVGVNLVLGHFKEKSVVCKKCGRSFKTNEEKETDVNIALRLVTDGLLDRYDTAILVSADSDLKPAIETIRHHRPDKNIVVVAPPKRFGHARDLGARYEIKPGRIEQHLLAETYRDASGKVVVTRPEKFRPPQPPAV